MNEIEKIWLKQIVKQSWQNAKFTRLLPRKEIVVSRKRFGIICNRLCTNCVKVIQKK